MKRLLHSFCLLMALGFTGAAFAGVADGRYILVNKNSGRVLDVSGVSRDDGANVIQWNLGAGLNQRWDIVSLGNGHHSIRAVHSGKSLDVYQWNTASGADIRQYAYHGGQNQQWEIVNNGDGYYRIVSRWSGKALDIAGGTVDNGGSVQVSEPDHRRDSQLWNLRPVGASGYAKTALEITADMGAGWNLGNTMDTNGRGLGAETYWGNPHTERYMIDAVAARGFKTLRIPVTWDGNLLGDNAHSIDPAWLERVEQIVNYGLDNGMYVIINIHHDEWVKPAHEHKTATLRQLNAIWSQIAAHFKDYNQYLIFETFNEPRFHYGTDLEWTGTVENYQVINELNSAALGVIRSSGGNNADRMVMVPAYAASPWNAQTDHFEVPDDRMVAVSAHGYIPYDFAESAQGPRVFTQGARELVDYVYGELERKYIDNGIPVVMGEWGTIDKDNTSERVAYARHFVTRAREAGIPTVVWDNGALGGNGHGYRLYHRQTNTWPFEEIVEAIISNAR